MTVREQLQRATRAAHEALEAAMPLARSQPTAADYARHLSVLLEVYAPLERRLAPLLPPALAQREKAPLLEADLRELGVDLQGLRHRPVEPSEETRPWAVGCAWVLEGATLGGTVMRRRLEREAPWFAGAPRRFLSLPTAGWPAFLQGLEEAAAADPAAAVRGAVATFEAIRVGATLPRR